MDPKRRLKVPHRLEISRRPLVTERTTLEPLDTSYHLKFWRAVDSARDALHPWLPWVPYNDSPAASYRYTQACERDWDNHAAIRFAVRLRHQSELIGVVSLENCSPQHRSLDLGYWLHPLQQGNGLMTEAARCIVGFAFQDMHVHRVRCAAAQENIASQKVIARLGFKREGIARDAEFVAGRWIDPTCDCQ